MDLNQISKEGDHCTHGSMTTHYGWLVQIILAIAAFTVLIVKKFCEPQRSWKIWMFDSSKQMIGCLIVHTINILTSEFFPRGIDPCTIYLISFILDTSIGLLLIYVLIKFVLYIAIKFDIYTLEFGFYGSPVPKLIFWVHQTLAYIGIVLIQKFIILIILSWKAWDQVRDLLYFIGSGNTEFEVALVLFIIPFIVNCFIFWIADSFLTIGIRSKKMLNFSSSGQVVVKKLQSLKNCISASTKLISVYDIIFVNTKQKLRNEEDDNLVEISLKTINNQTV